MPPFKSSRIDPYKNFKFRVKFEDSSSYVAGVSKVSTLKRTTEVVTFRDGGDESTSRKSPGRTEYDAITLERGVTHDITFEQWANKVWDYNNAQASNADQEVSLADFQRTSRSTFSMKLARRSSPTRFSAAGCRSTSPCPSWTPTPTLSPSSTSSWKTKDGSVTRA